MESGNTCQAERGNKMLKVLMLRKQLDTLMREKNAVEEKRNGFEEREKELEIAINELTEESTEEERSVVTEAVEQFEADKNEAEEQVADLEKRIADIEGEIAELEAHQDPADEEEETEEKQEEEKVERGTTIMNKRNVFYNMDIATRNAMFEREDVKDFLENIRGAIAEKRAITGGNLLVPEVFVGLIRENIMEYSKLYKHVNVRAIGGNGREIVMGTIPEAVWTDCCANVNELSLTFNDAEVGCWRVGGYFDICNATLQDSMFDLASEVLTVLGQAIGYALDKAIIFGLGTRMPKGFFTRLAETSQPADYPATARTWADLHTSNIFTIANTVTGVDLFRAIVQDSAAAKGVYSRGEMVWVMNEVTYTKLMASAMAPDMYGQIVPGMGGRMPVVGGIIEVLPFIPNDMIFGGYLDLYLLAEREGTRLEQSEHVHFLADRTVFKGVARYDGLPVIAEGFVAIGINGTTPSAASITFAPDTANTPESE